MPDMKDFLKSRVNKPVHVDIIDAVDVADDIEYDVNDILKKKKKFTDTHTRQTFYISNSLIEKMEQLSQGERGIKTKIVNLALRDFLQKIE